MTGVYVLIMAAVKVGLWLAFAYFAYQVYQRVSCRMEPVTARDDESAAEPDTLGEALMAEKFRVGLAVLAFFALIVFTQTEMAYRPKKVIQPDNSVLELQLEELDRTPTPVIAPAEGDRRDKAAYDGYSEDNAEENRAAEEEFLKLPDAD